MAVDQRIGRQNNLCLHCGAEEALREEVESTSTPRATLTWQPIPHIDLIERVDMSLQRNHLQVVDQAHSLSHDGARYFGLIHVRDHNTQPGDYAWFLGVRNSHDKRFLAGLVAGGHCFLL